MLTIRKATTADCELIHKLAWQIFPETYKDILSPEQNDSVSYTHLTLPTTERV